MKSRPTPLLARYARFIATLALGFALGIGLGYLIAFSQSTNRLTGFDLPLESIELLDRYYFGMLPESIVLQRGMTRGLLDAIDDPYTTYLDPVTNELEENTLQGAYGGIGTFITPTERGWALIPFEDGPAQQEGVVEGDILRRVDEVAITSSMSEAEVTAALRGPAGTTVSVEISRDSDHVLSFTIFRQALPLPSASSYQLPDQPNIGVIKLTGFGAPTVDEIRANLETLRQQGVGEFILDLRNNPGGLLDSSIAVADIFLSDGIIVTEVSYDGKRTEHLASADTQDAAEPLAVLINGGTASAAEVLAAALQGNQRAPLIGQPSFGKGSVQSIYGLSDGSSLHITTARWFNPDGNAIGHTGIQPDIVTDPSNGADDPALLTAIAHLTAAIKEQP